MGFIPERLMMIMVMMPSPHDLAPYILLPPTPPCAACAQSDTRHEAAPGPAGDPASDWAGGLWRGAQGWVQGRGLRGQ